MVNIAIILGLAAQILRSRNLIINIDMPQIQTKRRNPIDLILTQWLIGSLQERNPIKAVGGCEKFLSFFLTNH